jgi:alkanesulfonate monooxygenase SsuD/methylene tetrahydromethanopterin reductase-like flavin-dependent oxidoreductase (luciferase family)
MLALTGRAADGWVPSLGYLKPEDMREANARIDDAARAAGRDPSAMRRVLNVGGDLTAEDYATLVLEHGFDTFITSPDTGDAFIEELVPKVRELIAEGRGSG